MIVLKLPTSYFSLLIALVVFVATWEWGKLVQLSPAAWTIFILIVAVTAGLVTADKITPSETRIICFAAMVWWVAAAVWVIRFRANVPQIISPWRGLIAGCLVLLPSFVSLCAMHREMVSGPAYVLFLFYMIWAADSGAYFMGRRIGRHKMAPDVSPGKTWEGLAGGLTAAVVVAVLGEGLLGLSGNAMVWFVPLCVFVMLVSVIGDLLESLFKRNAGVKDSGRLLPGHGGVMDRIDSITAAAPAFYLGLSLFKWPT
jgi:phosphatidate cytidylyltransferase